MRQPVTQKKEEATAGELLGFIRKRFAVGDDRPLDARTPLFSEGIVDSIGLLEMISFIEERFRVTVHPSDLVLENFESVGAMCRFLDRQ